MHEERIVRAYERVITALKDVINDMKITEDELKVTGEFLNRMGQAELFTNMLNVAFSMTIVERRLGGNGTRPNLEGPYYRAGAPVRKDGVLFERQPGANAQLLEWTGKFVDAGTGKPVEGAEIDIWQADENGNYDHVTFHLRGVIKPDRDGRFSVSTVVPLDYSEHGDDPIGELFTSMGRGSRRAAHLHVKARAPGYRSLTTQLFIPWSPFLDEDYVEGAVTPELVLKIEEGKGRDGRKAVLADFDIALPREA